MELEQKKKQLQRQLLSYYGGDVNKVKKLIAGCKLIGFPLNEECNINAVMEKPEAFATLIGLSDFGILPKLVETVKILKG